MIVQPNDIKYGITLQNYEDTKLKFVQQNENEDCVRLGDLRVRCSALSDICKCRAIPYFPSDEQEHPRTEIGQDVHAECEKAIRSKFKDYDEKMVHLDYINSIRFRISDKGVYYSTELQMSRRIKYFMGLTGTADCVWIKGNQAGIIDLKTGRNEVEIKKNPQLMGYAWMLLSYIPQIEVFNFSIYQKNEKHWENVSCKIIKQFGEDVLKKIPTGLEFRMSFSNCSGCFNSPKCTYGSHILRNMENALSGNLKETKEVLKTLDNLGISRYSLKKQIEHQRDANLFKTK